MSRHVTRNFNTDLAQDLGLKEGVNKIRVSFIIDKNGNTKVLNVRTPDKRLEKEAIRVVKSMPKMTPAKIDGVSNAVKYNIPILFNVEN
jgi:protein TonB